MMSQMKRLTPASETIKKLLLRSGNECAFPGCLEVLFNDDNKLIGECCHIEAASIHLIDGVRERYGHLHSGTVSAVLFSSCPVP